MSDAPLFFVVVPPNKQLGTKGYKTYYSTAISAEVEAARLRSLGWSGAYAKAKKPREPRATHSFTVTF